MEGQTETPTSSPSAGSARPSRAQVLAEMPFANGPAVEKPSSDAAAPSSAAAKDVDDKAAETPPPLSKDEAAVDEKADKVEAKTEDKPDPDTDKRLSAVQKAEKRSREQLAKERAEAKAEMQLEFDRQRAALAPHMESLKAFQSAKEKAEVDPVGLLTSLGISVEKFDYIAQQIYNNSKAAEADPKRREFAAQAREKREYEARMEAMQKRIDAMENERKQAAESQENARLEETAFKSLSEAATDDTPLTKKLLAKNPAKARAALLKTARDLFKQTGEPPDAEDVLNAYEKIRAEELAELDVDVTSIAKPKAAPADEKRAPSKTLEASPSGAKPAPAKGKPSRDELLREMPWSRE